jgi:uncharacterized protein YndB with AHSA1/START domain
MNRSTLSPRSQFIAGLLACLALSSGALAGDRTLVTRGVVDATPHELWQAFTVDSEITKWMVAVAHMDLRIGGTLETSYDKSSKIGDPKNIRHTILSYEPDRMLSFTFTMPAMFKKAHDENGHWVVVQFEPVSAKKTLVTETIYGWGDGDDWNKAYAFFEKGDAATMKALQERFAAKTASKPDEALAFLRKLAGGAWTSEAKMPDGTAFRAKFYYEETPGHPFLTAKAWLGAETPLPLHGVTIAGLDAQSGDAFQTSCLEDGSIARMNVYAKENGVIELGDLIAPDGKSSAIRQELTLRDPTHLDIQIDIGDMHDPAHVKIALTYAHVDHDAELDALRAKPQASR